MATQKPGANNAGAFPFPASIDRESLETGTAFAPRFDANGLVPCITRDAKSGDVLMLAYMNAEALTQTLQTGQAHYWSRSRQALWRKGETSGQIQTLREMRIDCDQDTILMSVDVGGNGGTCHRGFQNCFYRTVEVSEDSQSAALAQDPDMKPL